MARLTLKVKVALVSCYYENNKSIISTQRAYRRKYGTKTAPDPKTIRNIVKNFEENGSVGDKKRLGPELTVRTPENIKKFGKNWRTHRKDRRDGSQERSKYLKLLSEE